MKNETASYWLKGLSLVEEVEGVEEVEEFKVFSLRFGEPSKFNSLGFQPQVIDIG